MSIRSKIRLFFLIHVRFVILRTDTLCVGLNNVVNTGLAIGRSNDSRLCILNGRESIRVCVRERRDRPTDRMTYRQIHRRTERQTEQGWEKGRVYTHKIA